MDENIGQIVDGEVTNVVHFGAFVKLNEGGEEGLVHISEIANGYVKDISTVVQVGDKVKVKVLGRNQKNKLDLSIKKALPPSTEAPEEPALFMHKKTKNSAFEDRITQFLKHSEEKQIDVRRNLKNKQGINKKRKSS